MTKVKIEPERILVNFLRTNLTDPNSSRSGQWVYDDFPRVKDLGDNSFPRVSVIKIGESGSSMGLNDDNQWETVTFQIDVWAKKDHVITLTTTDEALGTLSSGVNSDRLTYDIVPSSVTNIKHDGTSSSTVTAQNTDANFTAPASLSSGTVEWSRSTGNLNFSSADVTGWDTHAITSTSVKYLEGETCAKYVARDIVKQIRSNWRSDSTMKGLIYPVKLQNVSVPIDEDLGLFRQTLEYSFRVINAGEGI